MRALTMDEVESVSGGLEMKPGEGGFYSANWQNSVADSFWMMSAYSGLSQQMNDYQAVKEPAAFNTGAQPLIDMGLAPVKVTAQRVGAAEVAGIGLAEVVVTSRRDWSGGVFGTAGNGSENPRYCNTAAYKAGWFLDEIAGETIQDVGAGTVIAGGLLTVTTAPTGVGVAAGATTVTTGGVIYAAGTAISEIGNIIKWVSGQDAVLTAAKALSIPTMRLGPVGQLLTEKALSIAVDKTLSDPCQ